MISAEGLAQISRALRDPLKKKVLAKDETIIGGLILILSNPDKSIVIEALEILLSLAAPVEDRLFLREFLGMLDELNSLAHENNALDHIREKARQLISRLNSEDAVSTQSALLKQRSSNLPCVNQMNLRGAKNFSKPLFNMSKCRTITLEIEGLNDKTDMETCRERLLTVKGVVSITFDLPRKRSIIRVKPEISPNRLASAIDQSNVMLARQVVRTDAGEEKVVDLRQTCSVSTHKDNKNKENAHPTVLPAYLPEEDSPVKVDDRAVRRYGTKDEDVGAGWLGAAASFLAKSFYW